MAGNRGTQLIGSSELAGGAVLDAAVPGVRVRDLIDAVRSLRPGAESTELIEQLRELEDLKSAAAAAQARVAVAFGAAQRKAQADLVVRLWNRDAAAFELDAGSGSFEMFEG
ncbi:hypothetical protein ACSBOX_17055 [Arthrobacter sp. KN11-1C]|uniref:hypothetical protein n=1 Tax=Arthrobacter sp. KN11-1C TaxID=3445774 RepID=UPI003F9F2358